MITLTKVDSVEGGQTYNHREISGVLRGDLVFAMCSYNEGGSPYLTLSGTCQPSKVIGESTLRTESGDFTGDIVCKVAEAMADGVLEIDIGCNNQYNLDMYAVVFRPSQLTQNVNAYISTKVSSSRDWTDPIDVITGEYILCAQYSDQDYVRSSPQSGDKSGTSVVTVADWALPEGSITRSNSFMELIRVDQAGTFTYYGPNPTVMRITVQGDPALVAHIFNHGGEI